MRDYHFGNFIQELREQNHLSQYQLGMLVGVSDKAVSKWENGSSKPQSSILYKLSAVLGVTVDELLAGRHHTFKNESEKKSFQQKNTLWGNAYQALKDYYGDVLPIEVLSRYLTEYEQLKYTDHIIYFDLFSRIHTKAREMGEIIRIKGSIGASFVAFVMGATEINPLPPHYYCPRCRRLEFVSDVHDGWDLPPKRCTCRENLDVTINAIPQAPPALCKNKENLDVSHPLPINTIPQAQSAIYRNKRNLEAAYPNTDWCNNTDKARTMRSEENMEGDGHNLPFETLLPFLHKKIRFDLAISPGLYETLMDTVCTCFTDKTIIILSKREHPDLKTLVISDQKMPNVTNGQELSYEEYYDHFKKYPSITLQFSEKLQTLALLEKNTQIPLEDVPFTETSVLAAFRDSNTQEIPEFKTKFIKDMIRDVSPQSFHDLIQILGLAHGTGTWTDNARLLVRQGMAVAESIAYRDDIFHYVRKKLTEKNIYDTGLACRITADAHRDLSARSGLSFEIKQYFNDLGFENWFIDSIGKIQYVFPKAQGVQAIKDISILLWYKLHFPSPAKTESNIESA